jgi:hypothetical protein
MIQYKLIEDWFLPIDNQPFKIINIDVTNVLDYENDIKWLINSFHKRYEWDGFPNWEMIISRLEKGNNFFFLCQYNETIIGWVWFRKGEVDIIKEHVKFYCKTDNETVWGYNNFLVSSKLINKPENSGIFWCNLIFKKLFKLGIKTILVDTETSNEQSTKMCELNGMKKENWVNDLIINVKDKWGN